jgi:hypothetical protein
MKCPYYRKVSGEDHPFGFKSYCEADLLTGLRVPSLFEETHYCTTAHYPACRVFQAQQAGPEDTEEPKTSKDRC